MMLFIGTILTVAWTAVWTQEIQIFDQLTDDSVVYFDPSKNLGFNPPVPLIYVNGDKDWPEMVTPITPLKDGFTNEEWTKYQFKGICDYSSSVDKVYALAAYLYDAKENAMTRVSYINPFLESNIRHQDLTVNLSEKLDCDKVIVASALIVSTRNFTELVYCWKAGSLTFGKLGQSPSTFATSALTPEPQPGFQLADSFTRVRVDRAVDAQFLQLEVDLARSEAWNEPAANAQVLLVRYSAQTDGLEERLVDVAGELRRVGQPALLSLHYFDLTAVAYNSSHRLALVAGAVAGEEGPRQALFVCVAEATELRLAECIAAPQTAGFRRVLLFEVKDRRTEKRGEESVQVSLLQDRTAEADYAQSSFRVFFRVGTNLRFKVFIGVSEQTAAPFALPASIGLLQPIVEVANRRFVKLYSAARELRLVVGALGGRELFLYQSAAYQYFESCFETALGVALAEGRINYFENRTELLIRPKGLTTPTGRPVELAVPFLQPGSDRRTALRLGLLMRPAAISWSHALPPLQAFLLRGFPAALPLPGLPVLGGMHLEDRAASSPHLVFATEYSLLHFVSVNGSLQALSRKTAAVAGDIGFDLKRATVLLCKEFWSSEHGLKIHKVCRDEWDVSSKVKLPETYIEFEVQFARKNVFVGLTKQVKASGYVWTLLVVNLETRFFEQDSLAEMNQVKAAEAGRDCIFTNTGFYWIYSSENGTLYALYKSWDSSEREVITLSQGYRTYHTFSYSISEQSAGGEQAVSIIYGCYPDKKLLKRVRLIGKQLFKLEEEVSFKGKVKEIDMACELANGVVATTGRELWVKESSGVVRRIFGDAQAEKGPEIRFYCNPRIQTAYMIISNPNVENRFLVVRSSKYNSLEVSNMMYKDPRIIITRRTFFVDDRMFSYSFNDDTHTDPIQLSTSLMDFYLNNTNVTSHDLVLKPYFGDGEKLTYKINVTFVDYIPSNFTLASKIDFKKQADGDWLGEIPPANGHFLGLKPNKETSGVTFINRFARIEAVEADLGISEPVLGHVSCSGFEAYATANTIFFRDSKSGKVLGNVTFPAVELIGLRKIKTEPSVDCYSLLIRSDSGSQHQITHVLFFLNNLTGTFTNAKKTIASIDFDAKHVRWTESETSPSVGWLSGRNDKTLTIKQSSCPTGVMVEETRVSAYDLISVAMGDKAILVTLKYDSEYITFTKITLDGCQKQKIEVPVPLDARHYSGVKCELAIQLLRCVFVGLKVSYLEVELSANGDSGVVRSSEEYAAYKNLRPEQLLLSDQYFVVRGGRLADPLDSGLPHDAALLVYYRLKKTGGSGFVFGGLSCEELWRDSLGAVGGLQLLNDSLLVAQGAAVARYYRLVSPAVHSKAAKLREGVFAVVGESLSNATVSFTYDGSSIDGSKKSSVWTFLLIVVGSVVAIAGAIIAVKVCNDRKTLAESAAYKKDVEASEAYIEPENESTLKDNNL